jgi:hypothetical protein
MSKIIGLFNECLAEVPEDEKRRVDIAVNVSDETNTPFDLSIDRIHSEEEFNAACARIEELIPLSSEDVPDDDPNNVELIRIANLVADREDEHVTFDDLDEVGNSKETVKDETEYIMSSPTMVDILRQGDEDIKNGKGRVVKLEDIFAVI